MGLLSASTTAGATGRPLAAILAFALALLSMATQLKPPKVHWARRLADVTGSLAYLAGLGLVVWAFWPNKGVRIALLVLVVLALLVAAWWIGARSNAPTQPEAPTPAGSIILSEQDRRLLTLLRQLRVDLREAGQRLADTQHTGQFWRLSSGVLPTTAWKKNNAALLSTSSVTTALYDSLKAAFDHIERLNGIRSMRMLGRSRQVKPGDELPSAASAVQEAQDILDQRLAQLEGVSVPAPPDSRASDGGRRGGRRRSQSPAPATEAWLPSFTAEADDLRSAALGLGREIGEFARDRRRNRPRMDSPRHTVTETLSVPNWISTYDNDTEMQYEEQFAPKVRKLGDRLLRVLGYDVDDLGDVLTGVPRTWQEMVAMAERIERVAQLVESKVWRPEHADSVGARGHVTLTLRRLDGSVIPEGVGCVVTAPDGSVAKARYDVLIFDAEYMTLEYPMGFENAPSLPLARGPYEVSWRGTAFTEHRGEPRQYELIPDAFKIVAGGRVE